MELPTRIFPRKYELRKAQNRNDGYIAGIGSYPKKGTLGKVDIYWETAIM